MQEAMTWPGNPLLPQEVLKLVVGFADRDTRQVLRVACRGLRGFTNSMCKTLRFDIGGTGAEGMRHIAACCDKWSGLEKLQLIGIDSPDRHADALLQLLLAIAE